MNFKFSFLDPFIAAVIGSLAIFLFARGLSQYRYVTNNRLFKVMLRYNFYIYLLHDPLNFFWINIADKYRQMTYSYGVILFYLSRTVGGCFIPIAIYKCYTVIKEKAKDLVFQEKNEEYKDSFNK